MKKMTCECGYVAQGASDNDIESKMESHMKNGHADREVEHKKMMGDAKKTLMEATPA